MTQAIVAECWTCRSSAGSRGRFLCAACRGRGGKHDTRYCLPSPMWFPHFAAQHRAAGHDVRPVIAPAEPKP